MASFQPLTQDQYNSAIQAGFSPDQIIANEQKRKSTVSTPDTSVQSQQTASAPGFFSKVGSTIANIAKTGYKTISNIGSGFGSAIANTGIGLGELPLEMAQGFSDAIAPNMPGKVSLTPTINTMDNLKNVIDTQNGAGTAAGSVGKFIGNAAVLGDSAVTDSLATAKNLIKPAGTALAKLTEESPSIVKGLSYVSTKVLNAIPEAAVGFGYGKTQGETNSQAAGTAVTFGTLSGMMEIGADGIKKFVTGSLADNVTKALGVKGKMSIAQLQNKIPQATKALETIKNLAPDIKIIDSETGASKPFVPEKATMGDMSQAWTQARDMIYKTYSDLAEKSGANANFSTPDFGKLIDTLNEQTKNTTDAFKNKANSLIQNLKENYGTFNKVTGKFLGFKETPLADIQSFLEKVNKDVNPSSDRAGSEVSTKLSQNIRQLMDDKITSATGKQYQSLRNSYANLKSIESDLVGQIKKGMNGKDFVSDWLKSFGTLDTIAAIATGDADKAATGLTAIGTSIIKKYLTNPDVFLRRAFSQIDPEAQSSLKTRFAGVAKTPGAVK